MFDSTSVTPRHGRGPQDQVTAHAKRGTNPFWGTPLFLRLLPQFSAFGVLGERTDVLCQCIEVGGFSFPLSDVVVEHPRLCQKIDPFVHHHDVRDCLASCSSEFNPLFEIFNLWGKALHRIIVPHHINCVILEVVLVELPVAGEHMFQHGECGNLYKPCKLIHHWRKEDWYHRRYHLIFKAPSAAVYFRNIPWFCPNCSVLGAYYWALPMLYG